MVKVTVALVLILAAFVPCYAGMAFVTVEDGTLSPNYVEINLNDTVRWTWDDFISTQYGIASDLGQDELFESDELGPGGVYEHTFTHVGEFTYYGTWLGGFQYVGMDGTVKVLDTPSVPEPGSLIALGALASGLVGTVLRRRNRK